MGEGKARERERESKRKPLLTTSRHSHPEESALLSVSSLSLWAEPDCLVEASSSASSAASAQHDNTHSVCVCVLLVVVHTEKAVTCMAGCDWPGTMES